MCGGRRGGIGQRRHFSFPAPIVDREPEKPHRDRPARGDPAGRRAARLFPRSPLQPLRTALCARRSCARGVSWSQPRVDSDIRRLSVRHCADRARHPGDEGGLRQAGAHPPGNSTHPTRTVLRGHAGGHVPAWIEHCHPGRARLRVLHHQAWACAGRSEPDTAAIAVLRVRTETPPERVLLKACRGNGARAHAGPRGLLPACPLQV
mmetsp:Transcript_21091/g.61555  ORF Transcript_21091/g.61555 Transcript_21091/m.61555 type:complete len:206 (+) Transcript_21091:427-1044(+)